MPNIQAPIYSALRFLKVTREIFIYPLREGLLTSTLNF